MQRQCNFCVTKTRHVFIQISLGLLLSGLFGLGFGFFVMMLWNNLLPDIWGWKEITFWQGVGLVILTRLLFGSHGYQKETKQTGAGCQAPFAEERVNDNNKNNDHYYEQGWEEEGEASLEEYTKKMLQKKSSS